MRLVFLMLFLILWSGWLGAPGAWAAAGAAVTANNRGLEAMDRRDYKSAIEFFTQAIENAPNEAGIYNNRGLAYQRSGDVKRALEDYRKALEIKPAYPTALMNRSGLYYRTGQSDLALEDLNRALQLDGNNAEAYNVRGLIYSDKGDHQQALMDFGKAISISTKSSQYLLNRGQTHIKIGDWRRAAEDFNSTVELDPTNPKAYAWRARAALQNRQLDLALADANRALAIDPKAEMAHYVRGRVHHARGQFAKAIADYEKDLQLDPDSYASALLLGLAHRNEPLPGQAAPGQAAPQGNVEPEAPRAGEIRLMGSVQSVDAARGTLTLAVALFALPGGKTGRLAAPKPKIVRVDAQAVIYPYTGFARQGALSDIQPGAQAYVVGRDTGSGQELPARWIGTLQRPPAAKSEEVAPPQLPDNSVGRPQFVRRDGTKWSAGSAFAVRLDSGTPVLLSALHLIGTAGGLQADMPAAKVSEEISQVNLLLLAGGTVIASAQGALLREGFTLGERRGDYSGDLVAFRLPAESGAGLLPLAKQNPAPDEAVWIAGRAINEKSTVRGVLLYPARTILADKQRLLVHMKDKVPGTAFSGAPALNAKGEVVGIMLGSAEVEGATVFLLNPVEAIRERLGKAAAP